MSFVDETGKNPFWKHFGYSTPTVKPWKEHDLKVKKNYTRRVGLFVGDCSRDCSHESDRSSIVLNFILKFYQ